MSCEEFQLHAGAEPRALPWRALLHLLVCRTCAPYLKSVRALDLHIERALDLAPLRPPNEPAPARSGLGGGRKTRNQAP
jgi:hypothetical protein